MANLDKLHIDAVGQKSIIREGSHDSLSGMEAITGQATQS